MRKATTSTGLKTTVNVIRQNYETGRNAMDRVPPEIPIQMVRARDWVGPLPDRWTYFHYPNVDVVGEKVVVRYAQGSPLLGVAEQNLQKQGSVLRIYPIKWFYE